VVPLYDLDCIKFVTILFDARKFNSKTKDGGQQDGIRRRDPKEGRLVNENGESACSFKSRIDYNRDKILPLV
jgi:hypothetical protein